MHSLLLLMLVIGSCLAHYRGSYDTRNLIVREEPLDDESQYVECPVCNDPEHWIGSNEDCPIKRGNKTYKKCTLGTYINEVCGGKLDCYSGPGEECTEKMQFDARGKKCAPGFFCNKSVGKCTGLSHTIDGNTQWLLNRYSWRRGDKRQAEPKYFEEIRN